jgi:hypothetical protein
VDSGVGRRQGDRLHAGWLVVNDGKKADLIEGRFEDFIALAEVVFPGFENVIHGGGGDWAQALAWSSAMSYQTSPWLEW